MKCATKTNQIRTVFSRNVLECLQPEIIEINPFLSFRVDISGLQIIKYYSHRQKLLFLETFVYDFACFTLRHGQDLIQFHQSTCINNIIYFVVESEFVYMLNDNVVVEGESINIFVNKIEIITYMELVNFAPFRYP